MYRLKTRPQFQAVLGGETLARTRHFALHACTVSAAVGREPGDAPAATLFAGEGVGIGALVPKRWARRAVTRNAIKRQIYAVSSIYEHRLSPIAHVVRLRAAFDRSQFPSAGSDALKQAVRAELVALFSRAPAAQLP